MNTLHPENIENPILRHFAETTKLYRIDNGLYLDETIFPQKLPNFINALNEHNIKTLYLGNNGSLFINNIETFANAGFTLEPTPRKIASFRGEITVLVMNRK